VIDEERRELIGYRLSQAEEVLGDAEILSGSGSPRSVVNRVYYVMFYAVLALLLLRGTGSARHSGVISLFDREYVKSGVIDRQFSRWLHEAFRWRQIGDYDEVVTITMEEAIVQVSRARVFLAEARRVVQEQLEAN
jgi:uncharacterized protein (UPF0332 family)